MSIITFTLQIWWAGWGLHEFTAWQFQHFLILIFAAVCIYFAAEMALPDSDDGQFDMLAHSKGMGRISALAMLIYFLTGPYVNIAMFGHPAGLSLAIPLLGVFDNGARGRHTSLVQRTFYFICSLLCDDPIYNGLDDSSVKYSSFKRLNSSIGGAKVFFGRLKTEFFFL
nr:hypothetical protein [uncultured Glaciecola sp.]